MESKDIWHSYNVQKARNRLRMRDRYKLSGKIRKNINIKVSSPFELNQGLLIDPGHSSESTDACASQPEILEEDVDVKKEDQNPSVVDNFDLQSQIVSVHDESEGEAKTDPETVLEVQTTGDNYRDMARENLERIGLYLDQMDSERSLVCSQAILSMVRGYILPFREQFGQSDDGRHVDEDYLNHCIDCGMYYRAGEGHSC